ncbi:MAG: tRNA pseudouridine(55) synthase TruB [Gammaproteobacteria bacterium]|nr:tRNA pseudouridine(55) synthase TruB [Gammaproteobacteria bacterium]
MSKPRKARGRSIDGILLLDKPRGISSNAALQAVKAMYFAQKAGHTGSLDPIADGMLPLCFGEATKFSQYLLDADKYYRVTATLGIRTNSADTEGEVIATKPVNVTLAQLETVLEKFRGAIEQVPSMFSALKHQGQPLYKLARQGIEVERAARPVMIHELQLIQFEGDQLTLEVKCSKGTYVRNLIDDIGEALGCGAHVTALRRLGVAGFKAEQMVTLSQIEEMKQGEQFVEMDQLLLPMASALEHLPSVTLSEVAALQLQQGNPVQIFKAPSNGYVQLYSKNQQFIGIGEIQDDGKIAPRRLVSTAG